MMFGGRGGMGGGSGMLRTVGRTVARVGVSGTASGPGPQDPFSSSTVSSRSACTSPTSTGKPKSSSPVYLSSHAHSKNPISGIPTWHSSSDSDDYDWVCVDGFEDEGPRGHESSGHYLLGPVPSETEVEDAVSALQRVFGPGSHVQHATYYKVDNELERVTVPGLVNQVSSDGSEIDWAEPSLSPYNSKMLQANGPDKVYYAFHLLQTEPAIQRMVKSLSSDKAVWDAVLNNEAVRELRESISADELQSPDGTSKSDSRTTTNVVMWIFDTAKAKFKEVIEKITKVVNEVFHHADPKTATDAEGADSFNDKLRTSFMLSIMVLLVVVVSRASQA